MIRSGEFLGRMKNGNPVYAVATPSDANEQTDPGTIVGGLLVVGVIGVFALMGVMSGEERKRKKNARS